MPFLLNPCGSVEQHYCVTSSLPAAFSLLCSATWAYGLHLLFLQCGRQMSYGLSQRVMVLISTQHSPIHESHHRDSKDSAGNVIANPWAPGSIFSHNGVPCYDLIVLAPLLVGSCKLSAWSLKSLEILVLRERGVCFRAWCGQYEGAWV